MTLRVEEYVREDGTVPFKDWFERLDPQAAVKVATAVTRLSLGNMSNVKWFSGIGEIKVDWGPGYRVYLAKDGETARALLDESATLFLNGEPEAARLLLRDLVNATVGFEALAEMTHKPAKSLHRMLSRSGNPSMDTWPPFLTRMARMRSPYWASTWGVSSVEPSSTTTISILR